MIGDSVAKTIRSGTRFTLIRLRRVIVRPSETAIGQRGHRALPAVSAVAWPARGRSASGVAVLGRVAGEGEEDVVEVGPAQPDVQHLHAAALQPAQRLGEHLRATAHRQAEPPGLLVGLRLVRPPAAAAAVRRPRRASIDRADGELQPLTADLRLQLVAGAAGDDPAAGR